MNIPKLHFMYAYPFDAGRRTLFEERVESYPSAQEVMQKVGEYRTLWEEENVDGRIIKLLVEKLGVTLPRDLEVWVFGKGMQPMSSPFLVPAFRKNGASYTREQLIEIFIHETLHRFVAGRENNPGIPDYWKAIESEYAAESILTRNHIIIYAFLDVVLTELYGAPHLGEYVAPVDSNYRRAVEIVQEKGAQKLIDQFRSFLK